MVNEWQQSSSGLLLPEPPPEPHRPASIGWIAVPVLPQLIGRPLDDLARGLIHSLRPDRIRVSTDGWVTCDAWLWRVTVYTDGVSGPITSVEQEVEVGLPPGIEHGHAFQVAFDKAAPKGGAG